MAAKTVKLVTTFHAPSSVISSVKCKLVPGDVEHLVVAKMSRLEVFSLQPSGLRSESSLEIWGSVCSVKAVRRKPDLKDCDRLVVMLDHPQPELLFLDFDGSELKLAHALDLSTANALQRAAEFCMDFFVNVEGSRLVVSAYAGKLKVVCLEDGLPTDTVYDASAYENNILSICFVPGTTDSIAILHIDAAQRVRLIVRDLDTSEYEIASRPSLELPSIALNNSFFRYPDEDRTFLLPVGEWERQWQEDFRGGILIVGGRRLMLYERADEESKKRHGKKLDAFEASSKGDAKKQKEAREKQNQRDLRKRKPVASVDWPWSRVVACEAIDDIRFLIGDEYGRLGLVQVDFRNVQTCLVLIPLGSISPPTTITHLNGPKVFIGSHCGDSQLIDIGTVVVPESKPLPIPPGWPTVKPEELEDGPASTMDATQESPKPAKGKIVQMRGSVLSVTESFTNIAPIVDAALVDVDDSGQPQIVTCSGDQGAGRLHVIRSGADFKVIANADDSSAAHVSGIWPLRNMYDDAEHSRILLDTPEGTQLFCIEAIDSQHSFIYEPLETTGFLSARTLAAGNVRVGPTYGDSPIAVQVTTEGLRVCEYAMGIAGYTPIGGAGVQRGWGKPTAACVSESQIFVAYPGGTVSYFCVELQNGDYRLKPVGTLRLPGDPEIASICVLPPEPKDGKVPKQSKQIAVAYWDRPSIDIFKLKRKAVGRADDGVVEELTHTTDALPALVRCLTVQHFGGKDEGRHTYLIAGLANGSVVTYALRDGVTHDRKVTSLGSAPVSLAVYLKDGEPAVFAAGQHAALWSWEKKRLHHAAVMVRDVAAIAPLELFDHKDALLLASPTGLTVGSVQAVDKMHIRTIPLGGYTPTGIVHDTTNKVFGVIASYRPPGCIGIDTEPGTKCAFLLFDDSTYEELQRHNFADGTVPTAITLVQRPTDEGAQETFFCVATYDASLAEEDDLESGLLTLLSIRRTASADGSTAQIAERATRPIIKPAMQMTTVKGLIAAAVESAVMFFRPDIASVSSSTWTLNMVGEWNHNFVIRTLAVRDNHVAIGDQMHSISLVKVTLLPNDTVQLDLISSDYSPLFPTSLALGEKDAVIAANIDMNLTTFSSATASNGRETLDRDGAFFLGEMVNEFIPGSLSTAETTDSDDGLTLKPSYLFFTSVGRIGVVVDLVAGSSLSRLFTDLERNMSYVFRGVGVPKGPHEDHQKYRAPKNSIRGSDSESARGFVDGDFLEQFLQVGDDATARKVIEGKTVHEKIRTYNREEIRQQLEALQSLH
ncbi:mono-functional DNA-alkylating methyl methanesulfonate N-term-domain-containing protein [Schizophyllum commune]